MKRKEIKVKVPNSVCDKYKRFTTIMSQNIKIKKAYCCKARTRLQISVKIKPQKFLCGLFYSFTVKYYQILNLF